MLGNAEVTQQSANSWAILDRMADGSLSGMLGEVYRSFWRLSGILLTHKGYFKCTKCGNSFLLGQAETAAIGCAVTPGVTLDAFGTS